MSLKSPLNLKKIFLRFYFLRLSLFQIALILVPKLFWGQLYINTSIYIDEGVEFHIALPQTYFEQGIVQTSRSDNYGLLSFAPQASWESADLNSHVDGVVRMYTNEVFSFPLGNQRIVQPAQIDRLNTESPVDLSFTFESFPSLEAERGISQVSNRFYWSLWGSEPARIALTWNIFSDLDQLTENDLNRLSIAGFDGSQWRIIESALDPTNFIYNSPSTFISGSIRSKNPINLESYSALTLVAKEASKTIVNISQGFTPNGDGINDFWYIENIKAYPNAHIQVYTRWERLVFETKNGYQNTWKGTFENNQEPLPDGSYAYLIDLEGDGSMDLYGWIYITR